jgi:glucan biosynthesis protein C
MTTQAIPQTTEALAAPKAAAVAAAKTTSRFLYIDNVRAFLTILVLLHHIMIIYAGSGGWIYHEGRQDTATEIIGNIFCTINQAYFMDLFMLISAYFVPGAFDRKGAARFWKDRLARLGIPLALYSWVVNPLFFYWYFYTAQGLRTSFLDFFPRQYFGYGYYIGQGPMWFVEVLLLFTLVYAVGRWLLRSRPAVQPVQGTFPSNRKLALFALLMGLAGFIMRLEFPLDWNFTPLNFQLPFFAQYIFMFAAGLLAYRRGWLESLPDAAGHFWLKITGLVMAMYVPGALLGGALESDLPFKGGWHWQSLYFTVWEAFLCVGMSISMLYLFRRYANRQGHFSAFLSRNAYGAYIVQAPVITAVALAMYALPYHPLLKFVMAALVAVPLCFGISRLLRLLPSADRVL